MKLTLLSPERTLFTETSVESVLLFSTEGEIEILPGHAAMMGQLETGIFKIRGDVQNENRAGFISTGFYEVSGDDTHLKITADTLEFAPEIDVDRARKAQKKAEEVLEDPQISEDRFKKYQLKLQRALIRQQLGK